MSYDGYNENDRPRRNSDYRSSSSNDGKPNSSLGSGCMGLILLIGASLMMLARCKNEIGALIDGFKSEKPPESEVQKLEQRRLQEIQTQNQC